MRVNMPQTRDLRTYARQTTARLVIGGIAILLLVGDGLIYIVYGRYAAIMGLICIGAGLLPLIATLAFFWISDLLVRHYNDN